MPWFLCRNLLTCRPQILVKWASVGEAIAMERKADPVKVRMLGPSVGWTLDAGPPLRRDHAGEEIVDGSRQTNEQEQADTRKRSCERCALFQCPARVHERSTSDPTGLLARARSSSIQRLQSRDARGGSASTSSGDNRPSRRGGSLSAGSDDLDERSVRSARPRPRLRLRLRLGSARLGSARAVLGSAHLSTASVAFGSVILTRLPLRCA